MPETNTQTAALDETEAALANMNGPLAKLLRDIRAKLQGHTAEGEPEPPPKTEEAPAALDATPAPITEPEATVSVIDPEAMKRLDAEIEAKARAKAEQEATSKAPKPESFPALETLKAREQQHA